MAIVVSTVTSLVDIAITGLVDETNVPLSAAGAVIDSVAGLLGTVFLSGFLSRLVSQTRDGSGSGDRPPSIRAVLRSLPWGPLIRGDLLVTLIVILGLIALVIPGLVAANLLSVVGPVIEIEGKPAVAALRRSAHLVRQHFWIVALVATLPVIAVSEIEYAAPHPTSVGNVLAIIGIRGVAEAVAEAAVSLVLVELCYGLIALDRSPVPVARPVHRAG